MKQLIITINYDENTSPASALAELMECINESKQSELNRPSVSWRTDSCDIKIEQA
jgi:hypothetical protein